MSVGKFLQNSGLAALVAALAVTALPASAQSDDDLRRAEAALEARAQQRAQQGERRNEQRAQRVERRSDQRAAQIDQRSEQRAARIERQGDRAANQAARQGDWGQARQVDRRSEQRAQQVEQRGDTRVAEINRGEWLRREVERTYGTSDRDGRRDNDSWRDGDRRNGDRRGDNNWRDGRRDNNQWGSYDRRDNRRWDRRWRDNSRYDWQRYRTRNRVTFNIGTYYSPYRSYSYRRFGIGSYLQSLFYGQRYWINDPWQYRLPEVYGPYRWVRYYDDVLLVDIYSGEVVDVIYDFFW